jgi:hypothetical protein
MPRKLSATFNLLLKAFYSFILAILIFTPIFQNNLNINVNAQTTPATPSAPGEVNFVASVGFADCDFRRAAVAAKGDISKDVDQKFTKCLQSIIRFFFVVALFLIALRIAMEALANVNPMVGGKAVDNTINLVRDVTIGLILIGVPSVFLSFLNPTTLSLAGILNLQTGQTTATQKDSTKNPVTGELKDTNIAFKDITADQIAKVLAGDTIKGIDKGKLISDSIDFIKTGNYKPGDQKAEAALKAVLKQYPNGSDLYQVLAGATPDLKSDLQFMQSIPHILTPITGQTLPGNNVKYKISCTPDFSFSPLCNKTQTIICDEKTFPKTDEPKISTTGKILAECSKPADASNNY